MNVVVVGVGALGSHLILFGRNLNVNWTVIDFDRVEHKNILSQFHTKMSLRQNKATSIARTMQGLFGLKLKAIPHKLTKDNVNVLLKGADLVIDCVDNGATRKLIQDYVRKENIPCLHGALAAEGAFGRVIWDELFVIDYANGEGQATCEDGEHLTFIVEVSKCITDAAKGFILDKKKINYQVAPQKTMRI